MLTYQLQTRVLRLKNGVNLAFPNRCEIAVRLGPLTAFGVKASPSRTLVRARPASLTINANTGRWLGASDPPLERLRASCEWTTSALSLEGDLLRYWFDCKSAPELDGMLTALKWVLPSLLNLEFAEPPIVLEVGGRVGNTRFSWEHEPEEWRVDIRTVTAEKLQTHFIDSFERLSLFNGIQNRRLAAALSYFHVAVRLNVSGDGPWEFMAESILNLGKVLEILFAKSKNSKDDVRRELRTLGLNDQEIDGDFTPLLDLRNWIDVAHPRTAIFKPTHLKVLYKYVARAEDRVRDLLRLVTNKVAAGEYQIHQEADLNLTVGEEREMDKFVRAMNARLQDPVDLDGG